MRALWQDKTDKIILIKIETQPTREMMKIKIDELWFTWDEAKKFMEDRGYDIIHMPGINQDFYAATMNPAQLVRDYDNGDLTPIKRSEFAHEFKKVCTEALKEHLKKTLLHMPKEE